jgi:hypothetical protein
MITTHTFGYSLSPYCIPCWSVSVSLYDIICAFYSSVILLDRVFQADQGEKRV